MYIEAPCNSHACARPFLNFCQPAWRLRRKSDVTPEKEKKSPITGISPSPAPVKHMRTKLRKREEATKGAERQGAAMLACSKVAQNKR